MISLRSRFSLAGDQRDGVAAPADRPVWRGLHNKAWTDQLCARRSGNHRFLDPIGHLHVCSVSVRTVASCPGVTSTGTSGCGSGSGMTGSSLSSTGRGTDGCWGRGAAARAVAGRALGARLVVARPDRPRRWIFPITALRVTPPSCLATWLALRPSAQSFFRSSTRSSVHMACYPLEMAPKTVAGPSETISGRSAKTGFRTLEKG